MYLFNFTFGLGADISCGKTDIIAKANSQLNGTISGGTGATLTPGAVTVDASTVNKSPTLGHARLITGLGFNLGPIKIDMPVSWYFLQKGFSMGVCAGFVW